MVRKAFAAVFASALFLFFLSPALAQFSQQGPKLVGTGAVGTDVEQGDFVSLSADGNTAIVGGQADNGGAGAAWVWTRSGGVWTQQGTKLVGSGAVGNAYQGWYVCISADGNTAIIGGPSDNGGAGAAWVWTRSGGVWAQEGTNLIGSGAVGNAEQGSSVALSGDGNTAIVGGSSDNGGAGAAWVFTRSGGVWTQQGPKLVGSGAVGTAIFQGVSASLSGDGNTAIIGGSYDNSKMGAAWVFTRSGGVWTQQGGKLVASGAVGPKVYQGQSVSVSADGNTAIVGGACDNSNAGAAWVWTRSAGVWTQEGTKLVGSGAVGNAYQGGSVSLSGDGNTAIVGGGGDNYGAGAAWVFTRSGGVWAQEGTKLVGSGAVGNASQLFVSISTDGSTAILGGLTDNSNAGAVWIFVANACTTPSITGNAFNTCPEASVPLSPGSGYSSYQWNYCGAAIPGATQSSYSASLTGDYTLTVTDSNGCLGTSVPKAVTITFCDTSEVSPALAPYPVRIVRSAVSSTGFYLYFEKIGGATGYNIYEGILGSWYSHGSAPGNVCEAVVTDLSSGEMRTEISPSAGDHYYLVTAHDAGSEGPSGFDSLGNEIPAAQSTCAP